MGPFKAYRKEVLEEIEVYGELHRYIPVLAKSRIDYAYEGNGFGLPDADGIVYSILPHLAVMAVWGVGAAIIAARYFRWEARAI